jgi:hypothetical protein
MISSVPGTKVEQYLNDLIKYSEEPLASALKSIDLKKEEIKTPEDLILYLFAHKEKYSEEAVSKSIANLIAAKDLSAAKNKAQTAPAWSSYLWILWIVLGVGILSLFIIFWRRRKNQKK